jgi:hypothetical protein
LFLAKAIASAWLSGLPVAASNGYFIRFSVLLP